MLKVLLASRSRALTVAVALVASVLLLNSPTVIASDIHIDFDIDIPKSGGGTRGGNRKTNKSGNTPRKTNERKKPTIISLPLLHKHHVDTRRHLEESQESSSSSSSSSPPWGTVFQGYGTHYVDLWVGTPPQRQTVIIDTGSDITAFPCEECKTNCGKGYHVDENFKHSKSDSFRQLNCDSCSFGKCRSLPYLHKNTKKNGSKNGGKNKKNDEGEKVCKVGVSYAEGSSWDAFEAKDVVYLGGLHNEPLLLRHHHGRHMRRALHGTNSTHDHNAIAHNTKELENEFKKAAEELEEEYEEKYGGKTSTSTTEITTITENNIITAKDYSFQLAFGCQYKITGLFKTQLADGIMGMENSNDSFWMQMYNADIIQHQSFALCFTQDDKKVVKKTGTTAGSMTLGGSDVRLHNSKMVYAENDVSDGWYTVYVRGIYLRMNNGNSKNGEGDGDDNDENNRTRALADNDTDTDTDTEEAQNTNNKVQEDEIDSNAVENVIKLDLDIEKLNKRGIIIDSGTTDSYLPSFVNEYFEMAYKELYGSTLHDTLLGINADWDDTDFDMFPTILIQLKKASVVLDDDGKEYEQYKDEMVKNQIEDEDENQYSNGYDGLVGSLDDSSPNDVIIEIPPQHYLTFSDKKKLEQRIHIDDDEGFGILGANSMFGYDILFDMDNSRIGFAKSDCDHSVIAEEE